MIDALRLSEVVAMTPIDKLRALAADPAVQSNDVLARTLSQVITELSSQRESLRRQWQILEFDEIALRHVAAKVHPPAGGSMNATTSRDGSLYTECEYIRARSQEILKRYEAASGRAAAARELAERAARHCVIANEQARKASAL